MVWGQIHPQKILPKTTVNKIMKTTINLEQFDFNSRIFNQISDCPDTGFVRVLVYTGDNYQ